MKSINLLPKVPITKEYFTLILTSIIGLTLLGGAGLTYYSITTSAEIINQTEQRDELVARKDRLMQERMTDPQTASYKAFTKEVDSLKQTIRYWPPIFAEVTSTLPISSRILTMASSPEGVIKMSAEMGSMEAVADYIITLQSSSLLEKVSILSLSLKEVTPVQKETATVQESGSTYPYNAVTPPSSTVQTDGNKGSNQSVTPEEYVELLKNEPVTNSEVNETDELLEELDWMINRQMSKQLHGITIPNRTPGVTPAPATSNSPITQEDIDKARKAMEAVQQVQVTHSPKPAASSSGAGTVVPNVGAPTTAPSKKVYAVELELKCKPLVTKEK